MEAADQIKRFGEFFDRHYKKDILERVRKGVEFVVIDFSELVKFDHELADLLLESPEELIKAAEVAMKEVFDELPGNFKIRFNNLPENQKVLIRDIRSKHIGEFLWIEGIVRQKSDVRPQVTYARFECPNCGNIIAIPQLDSSFKEPSQCGCGRKGKFRLLSKELVDAQGIVLEEIPEHLEGGEQPKRINVFLRDDLVSPISERRTNPGSRIRIIGFIKEVPIVLRTGAKSTRFDLMIEGNYVESVQEDFYDLVITPEEKEKIVEISKDPKVEVKLVKSIAPSIYGYEKVKEALLLQLMGGVHKERTDGVVTRGDMHILLIGDPGSGKSQLLKRIQKIAPKGRYVSGKGVSGAGLCVSPDSLVMTNPGGMHKIKDVVEEKLKDNEEEYIPGIWKNKDGSAKKKILTLDDSLKIKSKETGKFWRLKAPKSMVEMTTRQGKKICLTKNTKLFSIKEGKPIWKKSSLIKEGDYIATARNIGIDGKDVPLTVEQIKKCNPVVHGVKDNVSDLIKEAVRNKKINKREFAKQMGFNENQVYFNWVNKKARGNIRLNDLRKLLKAAGKDLCHVASSIKELSLYNGHNIKIPEFFNEELMYFSGLIAGDGDLSKNNQSVSIRISSRDKEIIKNFRNLAKKLFNVKCNISSKKSDKRPESWRFSSNIVFEILNSLGIHLSPKSNKIDMSNILLNMPKKLVASYLRGIFDTDGSVIKRKTRGANYVDLTTTSREFAKKIQLVLLRYGINSRLRNKKAQPNEKIKGKHKKYILEIKGKDSLTIFRNKIGFDLSRKKKKLDMVIKGISKDNTNIDVIPSVHKIIKKIRDKHGLKSKQMFGSKTSAYFLNKFEISRNNLKNINKRISKLVEKDEDSTMIDNLSGSDVFWDKIVKKKIITPKYEYVYDLTVEDSHNFLVNGFVVHNTASVVKDEFLKGWSLEAGALVLANDGFCAIDEMDKMTTEDRSAMHEALEQQTVSISKANIQATLLTRTTVLAAANPKFGRFDPYGVLASQIDLPPALINRFDLIFPIKDLPDSEKDSKMAAHILDLHRDPNVDEPDVPTELMKKYVAYARQNVKPILTKSAEDEIRTYYVSMRNSGGGEESSVKAIPISARQLEALVRLSEASAKTRLSNKITKKDARKAIDLLQYCLSQIGVDPETGKIDIDRITTGVTASERGRIHTLREIIDELENQIGKTIPVDDVVKEGSSKGIEESEIEEMLEKLKRSGDIFEPKRGFIQKI
ncbi:hypothetical protein GF336_07105 [Candidatus Woesearchaeota archaeon]|nr:hypothetical protein [Candidatus Woesearchaeota archaeon]